MFPAVAFRPVRLFVISAVLTVLAAVAAGARNQLSLGLFFGLGMALGLVNALLVRRSVASITAGDDPQKSKMALNSATRLLIITVVAVTMTAVFLRHGGIGVVVGLAVFQVILVLATMVPVVKKLRERDPQPGLTGDYAGRTALDD